MGLFAYIVSGTKEACHEFYTSAPNCYYKDIDYEGGTDEEYVLWFSGQRKYLPSESAIQKASKTLKVDVRGSYEYEDRLPDEEPGTYFHYISGKRGKEKFEEGEQMYLDIEQYYYE